MTLNELLAAAILCFFIPLWMLAGFCDWLCHRAARISENAGAKESVLHLLMLAEVGLPLLAGLFLEINALLLALMLGALLAHEVTVWWDLRYAGSKRAILPVEQMVHSFQELIPLMLLALVSFLHWDQFTALLRMSPDADFTLAWKARPLPDGYLAAVLAAGALLVVLPFLEELWRCLRAKRMTHTRR